MIFFTAFLTGLLGSFHCVGMCGPIALALPVAGNSLLQKNISRLWYNAGRICTYAILGILLGSFGKGLQLAGMQQSISIAAGVIIILLAVFSTSAIVRWIGNPFSLLSGSRIKQLFSQRTYTSVFTIGLLNGLLPCGFVYIGLLGSVATQDAWQGALFMALFGAGTAPLMFTVSVAGQFLTAHVRHKIKRWIPVLTVLIGCLFIMRGMGLGIPYISPKISGDHKVVKDCCRK
jgi:sulfite exporter TauE/SafE